MKNFFIIYFLFFSFITFGQKRKSNEDLILFEKTVAIQGFLNEELENVINLKDTIDLTNEEKIKRNFAIEIRENVLDKVIENYEELIKEVMKPSRVFKNGGINYLKELFDN